MIKFNYSNKDKKAVAKLAIKSFIKHQGKQRFCDVFNIKPSPSLFLTHPLIKKIFI